MTATHAVDPGEIAERVEHRLEALGAPEQPDAPWRIEGREQADWAARKRAKALRQLEAVKTDAATQRAEIMEAIVSYLYPIDTFEAEETERLGREVAHWEAKLAEYHRDQLKEDDRLKTIKLPHAVLHSRKNPDKWEFTDAFLSWAEANLPFSVVTKKQVDKVSAKGSLKDAQRLDDGHVVGPEGDIIPGLVVLPGDTNYTIEGGAEL